MEEARQSAGYTDNCVASHSFWGGLSMEFGAKRIDVRLMTKLRTFFLSTTALDLIQRKAAIIKAMLDIKGR